MDDATVLCVDPDDVARERAVAALEDPPGVRPEATLAVETLTARSVEEARTALLDHDVDCVVTEFDLPDGDGFEVAQATRELAPSVGCVLYTDADRTVLETGRRGVLVNYLPKSGEESPRRLAALVRTTVEQQSQTPYPIPDDEETRLEIIEAYGLGDPELERALSGVTNLAATHFGLPVASVNLITDRSQQILACHGADWESTTREDSVCTYAILEDGVTVIGDVMEDPRFRANETLSELGIRFYAGRPLFVEGSPIGTLCVYDYEPGTLDAAGRAYLDELGAVAEDMITFYGRSLDPAATPEVN